ncbi:MAG TPA: hypothetical protein PK867_25275 [Pirellulales bacterium]|nr:hypothetical protein [Pirellulales bacterium]
MVVWKAFASLASEDRSSLILDAYGDKQARIALALGVTFEEALEQQVLPYAVTPLAREGEANFDDLKKAMIEEGGFALPNGKVELRFPSMAMAEAAHRRLCDKMPRGYWSIVQNPVPIS